MSDTTTPTPEPSTPSSATASPKQPWYKVRRNQVIVIIVALLAIIIGVNVGTKSSNTSSAPTTAPAPPATTAPRAATPTTRSAPAPTTTVAAGPKTSFGDGDWTVGKEIAAGTYATTGGPNCYWERQADFTGSTNSTLANDNASGPVIVTITPSDAGFKSQGCGTWSSLPSSGSQATSVAGDGYYAVGITIAPGTYSTTGGSNCYWETDSDYTGSSNSTIANDNPTGPTTVTIDSPAVLFKTSGCATWTKQ